LVPQVLTVAVDQAVNLIFVAQHWLQGKAVPTELVVHM
jgi:hypothetical protein